ncbi:MAG: hypothetical protein Q7Q73_07225 [Verrucomicrobiota bacterium JB024]|nr:hypothetical protein [Verrucomicrobiota bacterium JB024]
MTKKNLLTLFCAAVAGTSAYAITVVNPTNFPGTVVDVGDGTYNIEADLSLGTSASSGSWDSTDGEYILDRAVFVTNGATLSLDAGVLVRGQPRDATNQPGTLCVTKDGFIDAEGTAADPIIFTTAADTSLGRWESGDTFLDSDPFNSPLPPLDPTDESVAYVNLWGAVTILGNAPCNAGYAADGVTPGIDFIEGYQLGTQTERIIYGGQRPFDNSGIFSYVSIRHSGDALAIGKEQQGLTLGGVGAGTRLEYIDIYCSGDDGIEIFGGTVGLKNIMLSYFDDDGLDLDQGYTGYVQFAFILGSSLGGPDGTNTVTVASSARSGGVVTVTSAYADGLSIGDTFTVSGIGFSSDDPNGTFTVASVIDSLTFTYADAGADETFTASTGTVTYTQSGETGLGADWLGEWDGEDDIPEDDNNISPTGQPFANPTLYNVTFMGPRDGTRQTLTGGVIRARQGFGGNVFNSIMVNTPAAVSGVFRIDTSTSTAPVDFGYASTSPEDQVAAGTLNFAGTLWYNVAANTAASIAKDGASSVEYAVLTNNTVMAPGAEKNFVGTNPQITGVSQTAPNGLNPVPSPVIAGSASRRVAYGATFFDEVSYIGAFAPSQTAALWTTGWTAMNLRGILVDSRGGDL